jgi:hypothetical protein
VVAHGAACCCPKLAVSGHMPSDAADYGAPDASFSFGLKRRDCNNNDERRENFRMNFHVAFLYLFGRKRKNFRFVRLRPPEQ